MKLKLISDGAAESVFDGKTRRYRRIVAQGTTDFIEQFVEIQLPEDDKRQVPGEFEFRLKSVSSLFQGKARLQGDIVVGK